MLHVQARHVTLAVAALPGVRRYCHTGAEGSEPESPAKKRQNPAVTSLLRILVGFFLIIIYLGGAGKFTVQFTVKTCHVFFYY